MFRAMNICRPLKNDPGHGPDLTPKRWLAAAACSHVWLPPLPAPGNSSSQEAGNNARPPPYEARRRAGPALQRCHQSAASKKKLSTSHLTPSFGPANPAPLQKSPNLPGMHQLFMSATPRNENHAVALSRPSCTMKSAVPRSPFLTSGMPDASSVVPGVQSKHAHSTATGACSLKTLVPLGTSGERNSISVTVGPEFELMHSNRGHSDGPGVCGVRTTLPRSGGSH